METKVEDFKAIKLKLASPEDILEWSHGEVLKPETINYRTQRPEKDGLFCEKIFGPTKDWECACGKYKRIRYKGVVCDRCGVEVTRSSVRRERMGHIKLAVPVTHIWFLKGVPSSIGLFLDKSFQELEKIVYFAAYIITEINEEARKDTLKQIESEYKQKLKTQEKSENLKTAYEQAKKELRELHKLQIISEFEYRNFSLKYGHVFKANTGAEAIRSILKNIDLEKLELELKRELEKTSIVKPQKKKILKRLRLIQGFLKAKLRPEWMCITILPVLPPDLRPMVQLDGGRFATSDLNDLYRRVINRNNRLKRLIKLGAPEIIQRNEKRMLQEAVDALIDNSARSGGAAMAATGQRRVLRSLADMLKGKQGRFRQNLLGKRVDYSGRSVIVVGPELKLYQTGLPKEMALELFKPFVVRKLIEGGSAYNVRSATRLISEEVPEVWDILEKIIKDQYVLLNRAPTLHRLGIQAFKPILIEGKAIQIHPLVCKAFNADFDGDQMAVHIPLTQESRKEAADIMLSSHNLLKPASGEPIVIPSQDMVLGCYYMTKIQKNLKGEGKFFNTPQEAILAYELDKINLKSKIKIRLNSTLTETCVGRIIFNEALPKELRFVNKVMDAKSLKNIVAQSLEKCGHYETVALVDRIKKLGFEYATRSGMSWGIDDLSIPEIRKELYNKANKEIESIHKQYREGLLTDNERRVRILEIWTMVKNKVADAVKNELNENNPVYSMIDSGARSSWAVLTQMMGMKGLVVNPAGDTIELPIKSSFKEGFNVLEYFISTHGARKGMTDIALRTATAGYLTRRLVDVAQDVVVRQHDCGDTSGVIVSRHHEESLGRDFTTRIIGRTALEDIKNPATNKTIVAKGNQISKEKALEILKAKIDKVRIRSVIKCKTRRGICQACYGYDLGSNKLVALGAAVGIVTAQAIGEPGTQLTMRTFHTGGVAGQDITQGLPRVQEIFENRVPKGKALISEVTGQVAEIKKDGEKKIIKIEYETKEKNRKKDSSGFKEYTIPANIALWVKEQDLVVKGQQLTEGHLDLQELFTLGGIDAVQDYIVHEVQQIYSSQGEGINDKHIEIIVRQMLSRVRVKDPGDTDLLFGDIVEKAQYIEANEAVKKKGGKLATAEPLLLGITKASLSTESFLSAASFQETARVLINAAVTGKKDYLRGLKENVIIGKLIPVGTGYREKS